MGGTAKTPRSSRGPRPDGHARWAVKPLTTAGMAAAHAGARRAVEAIERQARERTEAGLPLDGLPDLSAEGERDGFYQAQLIWELAVRHITSWRLDRRRRRPRTLRR